MTGASPTKLGRTLFSDSTESANTMGLILVGSQENPSRAQWEMAAHSSWGEDALGQGKEKRVWPHWGGLIEGGSVKQCLDLKCGGVGSHSTKGSGHSLIYNWKGTSDVKKLSDEAGVSAGIIRQAAVRKVHRGQWWWLRPGGCGRCGGDELIHEIFQRKKQLDL